MSYQLIYRGKLLPTSENAGGQVVAVSSGTPKALKQELLSISRYRRPDEERRLSGNQHSYRMLICAETTFHVLSGLRMGSNGEYCIHHLALTQDEVQTLRRNASRPTPAGVTLALYKIGFWHNPEEAVNEEPRLTAAALPDASVQPTWKRLTGHKSNARALLNTRCERECIMSLPETCSSEDVLGLLHESEWLAAGRGWGKTFTTHGSTQDSTTEFARIATHSGSQVALQAAENDIAVLEISPELSIAEEQTQLQPREQETPPQQGHAIIHYKYEETPDEAVFNLPPKPRKWVRLVCIIGGVWVLWSSVSLVSGLWMDDAGELTGNIITRINTEEDMLLLSELATAPYSAETTARKLDKLEAHLSSRPTSGEDNSRHLLLQECVRLLRCASTDERGHAANMNRLAECAPALRLDSTALCCLYMNELIHDRQTEEWLSGFTPEETQEWHNMLAAHPDIREKFSTPPFADYLPQLPAPTPTTTPEPAPEPAPEPTPEPTPEPPPVDTAPAENPAPAEPAAEPAASEPQPEVTASATEAAEALVPTVISTDTPIPQDLLKLLGDKSIELNAVEYDVVPIGTNTRGIAPISLRPENKEAKLSIAPSSTPGEWTLSVTAQATQPLQTNTQVRLSTKDGKLQHIVHEGLPAAIRLKLRNERNILCTYMLIPSFKAHIRGSIGKLNKVSAKELLITPERIMLTRGGTRGNLSKLDFRKDKGFKGLNATLPLRLDSELQLQLPAFTANSIVAPTISEASPYSWKSSRLEAPNTLSDIRKLNISQFCNFETPLLKTFLQTANVCCCGEKPDGAEYLTLASLYSIANEKNSSLAVNEHNTQLDRYFKLFSNKYFADQLRRILHEESYLWLEAEEATGNKGSLQARRRISKHLKNPSSLKTIRNRICEVLTNVANKTYSQQYERLAHSRPVSLLLTLRSVTLNANGELTWHFVLEPLSES